MTQAGPLVQLHISVTRSAWRLAPAWSVAAGAVAALHLPASAMDGMRVVGAVILGDLVWGMLRRASLVHVAPRVGAGRPAAPYGQPAAPYGQPAAPYGQPASPVGRLLQVLAAADVSWQGAAAGVVLALGGGLLFGWPGLLLSLAALVCAIIGWSVSSQGAGRGRAPAACHAVLDVLLPWLLGIVAAGRLSDAAIPWEAVVIGAALTVLQWGFLRTTGASGTGGALPLFVGMGGVLAVHVGLGWPGAAAVTSVLFAPVAYLYAGGRTGTPVDRRAAWAAPALYLALFVAAYALRQSP